MYLLLVKWRRLTDFPLFQEVNRKVFWFFCSPSKNIVSSSAFYTREAKVGSDRKKNQRKMREEWVSFYTTKWQWKKRRISVKGAAKIWNQLQLKKSGSFEKAAADCLDRVTNRFWQPHNRLEIWVASNYTYIVLTARLVGNLLPCK